MLILVLLGRSILNHHTRNMSLHAGTCFWVTCLSPLLMCCVLQISISLILFGCILLSLKYGHGRYRAPEVLLQSSTYGSAVGQYIVGKRLKFYEVWKNIHIFVCRHWNFISIFSLQICGQWVLSWLNCLLSVLSFQDRGKCFFPLSF